MGSYTLLLVVSGLVLSKSFIRRPTSPLIRNDQNEKILTQVQSGWRICIDYRKLNVATRKDNFSLPFMDQMLERLARHSYYCFRDGYWDYTQISIAPEDQEKTTFTCPFGTYAFRRMPLGCAMPLLPFSVA